MLQPVIFRARKFFEIKEFPYSVHMPLHDMPSESAIGLHWQLEVHESIFFYPGK